MKNLFRRKPKTFSGTRVTHSAIEIVEADTVVQYIGKDEIQFIRIGRDKNSRMFEGYVIYLHASENEGLPIASTMNGCGDVERFMLDLPRVNKKTLVVIMESTSVEIFDVWRRE